MIVICSATIGNPGELADALTGRAPRVVDRNGAPSGERHLLFVDPPVIDAASGARGSALTLAQRWALPFLRAGRQTIVFGRSRTAVELDPHRPARDAPRGRRARDSRVRGYRGGYLPTERRAIEEGLRDGEVLGVVSHERARARRRHRPPGRRDPGRLPGLDRRHLAADRAGPAGGRAPASRSSSPPARPVDQYVVHHPEFLLDRPPEEARLDPDNLHVLLAHLKAAAFELPFEPGERFGPGRRRTTCSPSSPRTATSAQADDGRWYWSLGELPGLGDLAADRAPRRTS